MALAIWNRTSTLTHANLEALRLDRRTLVRFWGQRNTAHLYATRDWPFLHTAIEQPRSAPELELESERRPQRSENRPAERGG